MVHDVFELQPIEGKSIMQAARFESLTISQAQSSTTQARCFTVGLMIKCRLILRNIISGMGPDSAILLDEMVRRDTDAHWHTTQSDLSIMAAMAGMERTRSQWKELLGSIRLMIADIYIYLHALDLRERHVCGSDLA